MKYKITTILLFFNLYGSSQIIDFLDLKEIHAQNTDNARNLANSNIVAFGNYSKFDNQGRIFSSYRYDSIFYNSNNRVAKIYKDSTLYSFTYNSLNNILKIKSRFDTLNFYYSEQSINIRYITSKPDKEQKHYFKLKPVKNKSLWLFEDSLDVKFNYRNEIVYLRVDWNEYYYYRNKLIKNTKHSIFSKTKVSDNYVYSKSGVLFYSFWEGSNICQIYNYEQFKTIINKPYSSKNEKIIHFKDENGNILRWEKYENEKLTSANNIDYVYFPKAIILSKMHPKEYVPLNMKYRSDTATSITSRNIKFDYRNSKIIRIESTGKKNDKIYHYVNDTLSAYEEFNKKESTKLILLIKNDSIKYLRTENLNFDTTEIALKVKLRNIQTQSNSLKSKFDKFEYKLMFFGQTVKSNKQIIHLNHNSKLELDGIYVSNPSYKIVKIRTAGTVGSASSHVDIGRTVYSNKLHSNSLKFLKAPIKSIGYFITIENKDGNTETIRFTVK